MKRIHVVRTKTPLEWAREARAGLAIYREHRGNRSQPKARERLKAAAETASLWNLPVGIVTRTYEEPDDAA